jgi:hypothetical protein
MRGIVNGLRRRVAARALACASLVVACSDSKPTETEVPVDENTLVFTRANQSTITFANGSQLRVWCGPWEPGAVPTPAVHVVYSGTGAGDPGWMMTAVVADVVIGTPLTFPNAFPFDQPRNAQLFINDPPNELSSAESASSGSVTFQQLNCSTGGRVAFTTSATLASEVGGPSVSVSGKLSAPVGQAP